MIATANIWAAFKDKALNNVWDLVGAGAPVSGSGLSTNVTPPTGLGFAGFGSSYRNLTNGVEYWNEGTALNPYWTPRNINHPALLSWYSDFKDGVGKAIADTAATATLVGSGLRIFGNAIIDVDSGLTIAIGEDGPIASLIASATANDVAALGVGITTSVPFQPDSHGPLVIDALITNSSAITLRRFFMGFIGTAADALVSPVTGTTLTLTLVQDDLAGLFFDVGLTDGDRLFAPHNKSDEAATILTTATGVDTGVDIAAAGTYQRLRIEISAAGVMTCFVNKIQVTQIAASLDANEEVAPVLLIASTSSATKTLLVKKFATWGSRASYLS